MSANCDTLRLVGAAVCLLAASCLPAPGTTGTFYVVLPYVASVVCCGMACAACWQVAPWPAREAVNEAAWGRRDVRLGSCRH